MKNNTDARSQIRFGGFNEDLFVDKHSLQWIPTTSPSSWKIVVHSINFNGDDVLQESSTALINPGFPYIAAPFTEFKRFKTDLKYAHATLKCEEESNGLCYFKKTCQSLADRLPPLIFTLGPETRKQEYTVPASSFLFTDPIHADRCYLGVLGQSFNDMDYWVLGGSFLQNYYVAFDASRDEPYVGITLEAGSDARVIPILPDNTVARDIGIIVTSIVGLAICVVCVCWCRM